MVMEGILPRCCSPGCFLSTFILAVFEFWLRSPPNVTDFEQPAAARAEKVYGDAETAHTCCGPGISGGGGGGGRSLFFAHWVGAKQAQGEGQTYKEM